MLVAVRNTNVSEPSTRRAYTILQDGLLYPKWVVVYIRQYFSRSIHYFCRKIQNAISKSNTPCTVHTDGGCMMVWDVLDDATDRRSMRGCYRPTKDAHLSRVEKLSSSFSTFSLLSLPLPLQRVFCSSLLFYLPLSLPRVFLPSHPWSSSSSLLNCTRSKKFSPTLSGDFFS